LDVAQNTKRKIAVNFESALTNLGPAVDIIRQEIWICSDVTTLDVVVQFRR
jgi:hypothetical protein